MPSFQSFRPTMRINYQTYERNLRITRFRKWFEIMLPSGHSKSWKVREWMHEHLSRKEFVILETKHYDHFKFRKYEDALLCFLAIE